MTIYIPIEEYLAEFPLQFFRRINKKTIMDLISENYYDKNVKLITTDSRISVLYTNVKLISDSDLTKLSESGKSIFINPNFIFLTEKTLGEIKKIIDSGISLIFTNKNKILATNNINLFKCENNFNDSLKSTLEISTIKEKIDLSVREYWWILERLLEKKKIIIHPMSKNKLGMGHIYRGLTLANHLGINHEILFILESDQNLGIEVVKNSGYNFKVYIKDPLPLIKSLQPDIIINDLLDTTKEYMTELKKMNLRVINFEDMGEGAEYADAVINALYPGKVPNPNFYTGENFYCIREDFYGVPPKKMNKIIKNVLITYGGEDPSFLSMKTLRGLINVMLINNISFDIDIILGPAFKHKKEITNYLKGLPSRLVSHIKVYENIKNMPMFIRNADLVFTSAGRTMYEIATIATPAVVSAQNYRELTHTFGHPYNGFYNLGYGQELSENDYSEIFLKLYENYDLRKLMHSKMKKLDFTQGIFRVEKIIIGDD